MKNLFLSLVLVMISLVANSQLPSHLNLQEIQKEFMILYYKRCDSLGHKIVEDKSLVCLTECQVNYLSKLEDISHEQEVGSKFYLGKTLNKQTNKGLAKRLFNNFLKSDSHREIMDDKKLIKVNFQVGLNKCNSIYIVGVLSNQTLK